MKFHLKFEIADGEKSSEVWGETFLPARKARKISGRISEQISEKISGTSFQVSRLFRKLRSAEGL